jgi:hypothetical protein
VAGMKRRRRALPCSTAECRIFAKPHQVLAEPEKIVIMGVGNAVRPAIPGGVDACW